MKFGLTMPSWLLRDDGLIGRALHALVGYSDRPMGVQLATYVFVLTVLISLGRYIGSAPEESRPAV